MRENTIARVLDKKAIVIVRGLAPDDVANLAAALYDGGIELIEFTFNQADPSSFEDALRAIRYVRDNFEGKILPGAGTVLTPEQVDMAADAGAQYIISPDTNPKVIAQTLKRDLVSMPGAMTPTEVLAAHNSGADFVKLFPVGNLGCEYIKALRAPISHVRLLAVGGVSAANAKAIMETGVLGVGVGGSLVDKTLIAKKDFAQITKNAKELLHQINQ